jgi:hypothetical protein
MAAPEALATLDACAQAELVRRGAVSPTDPWTHAVNAANWSTR